MKTRAWCPLCKKGIFYIYNKKKQRVFQKHIGVGFWNYGQSRGKICFSSFKKIDKIDLVSDFEKEKQLMLKLFPPKNTFAEKIKL